MAQQANQAVEAVPTSWSPQQTIPSVGTYQHITGPFLEVVGIAFPETEREGEPFCRAFCHDFTVDSKDLPVSVDIRVNDLGEYSYYVGKPEKPYGMLVLFHPQGKPGVYLCMKTETFMQRDKAEIPIFIRSEAEELVVQ